LQKNFKDITDTIRDLDSHCTIPEIRQHCLKVILLKLNHFTNATPFKFNPALLNLHDLSSNMNVDMDGETLDQGTPYFRSQCMTKRGKTGVKLFKKPANPFKLFFHIPSNDWERWEEAELEISQPV
jgi:hypothetical protein